MQVSAAQSSVDVIVTRNADMPVQLNGSQTLPILSLRCIAGNFEVALLVDPRLADEYGIGADARFEIGFDDEPKQNIRLNQSLTSDSFVFSNPQPLLESLVAHEALHLNYRSSNATLSTGFTLTELENPLRALATACRLDNIQVQGEFALADCSTVETFLALGWTLQMQPIVKRFTDIETALDAEEIRNDIAALQYPDCLTQAREYVLTSIDEARLGMLSPTRDLALLHKNNAVAQMTLFIEEVERLISD